MMRLKKQWVLLATCTLLTSGCHLVAGYESAHTKDAATPELGARDLAPPSEAALPDVRDLGLDGRTFDATPDATFDGALDATFDDALDATPDATPDTTAGWALILTLRTESVRPHTFSPSATDKTGKVLRWDLGDGTIIEANQPSHTYDHEGEKTVRVYSRDGILGITSWNFYDDALVGSIPPEFGEMANLERLFLHDNQLEGTIPQELGMLEQIEVLSLSVNNLTGYIRGTFSGMLNITYINLMNNRLTPAAVDAIIEDVYQDRGLHPTSITKTLSLGGSNAAPSAASLTKIAELNNSYGWNITCNGC